MLLEILHRLPPSWRESKRQSARAPAQRLCKTAALRLSLPVLLLACATASASAAEIDPQALANRPMSTWTPAEREFGFAHWDQLYPSRVIARGPRLHDLPRGRPAGGLRTGRCRCAATAAKCRATSDVPASSCCTAASCALSTMRWLRCGRPLGVFLGGQVADRYLGRCGHQGRIHRQRRRCGLALHTRAAGQRVRGRHAAAVADNVLGRPVERGSPRPRLGFGSAGADACRTRHGRRPSYMKTLRRAAVHGTRWNYNTGEADLLGVVVSRATRKTLARYASEVISAAYGMENDASWTLDRSGHEHGGGRMQATTRRTTRAVRPVHPRRGPRRRPTGPARGLAAGGHANRPTSAGPASAMATCGGRAMTAASTPTASTAR